MNIFYRLVNDRTKKHLCGEAGCKAILVEELVLASAASIDVDVPSKREYWFLPWRHEWFTRYKTDDVIPVNRATLRNPL